MFQFGAKNSYEKRARKTLMKMTVGFPDSTLSQRNEKLQQCVNANVRIKWERAGRQTSIEECLSTFAIGCNV